MTAFSILCNLTIAALTCFAVSCHLKRSAPNVVLRYFTILSNLLCAAASLLVAVARLCGTVSPAVLAIKYMGTVSVTVTFLTVLVFLGPLHGYKAMYAGWDLWLHLLCPLLALLSYILCDRAEAPWTLMLLGILPVILYGLLYLKKAILTHQWDDFYSFNRKGNWPLTFAVMMAGTALICTALWVL